MEECEPRIGGDYAQPGKEVQVDPMRPKLKPPGIKRLKLGYDGLLSNFGFKFNLRRYNLAAGQFGFVSRAAPDPRDKVGGCSLTL